MEENKKDTKSKNLVNNNDSKQKIVNNKDSKKLDAQDFSDITEAKFKVPNMISYFESKRPKHHVFEAKEKLGLLTDTEIKNYKRFEMTNKTKE